MVVRRGVHTPAEHLAAARLAARVLRCAGLGAVRTCSTRFLFHTRTVSALTLRPDEWLALVDAAVAALAHASCCFAPLFVTVEFRPAQQTLWLLHPVRNTVRLSAACMYDAAAFERVVVQACTCCFCWQGLFFDTPSLARRRAAVLTAARITDADIEGACCTSLEQLERKAARVLGVESFARGTRCVSRLALTPAHTPHSVPGEEYAAVLGALVLYKSQRLRGKLAGLHITVAKGATRTERVDATVTLPADAPSVAAHIDALCAMVSG